MTPEYSQFLASKAPRARSRGVCAQAMPSHMSGSHAYQADVTRFLVEQGCGAAFLDTGLGKTAIELEWCRQTAAASNGRALLLTPLAVARQIEREAIRFGYSARVIRDQSDASEGINILNYDRLELIDPAQFGAVALDESSILKSFTGATTRGLIASFSGVRFKLAATATPAPNDHMELGTHAHFLDQMTQQEMLMRWFINDTATASQQWRLKKHAEASFWDWMVSWARCAETPADLGYDASAFILPQMSVIRHQVAGDTRPAAGMLFAQDVSAINMHDVKRQTADARAQAVADLVSAEPGEPWVVWCDTDYEADALAAKLPGAVEVRGSHPIETKERNLAAFADGSARVIITKPSIAGFGLNWQHCARMAFVGRSFSYEAWYQAVRRCWRFGQTRPVQVHIAVAEGEDQIGRVIDRKSDDHNRMRRAMASAMKRATAAEQVRRLSYNPQTNGSMPQWLKSAA